MTVLPTVRRQLEQAAARQAATSLRGRAARRSLRPRLPPFRAEGIIAALGVIVALGVAVLAVALLHHTRTTAPATPTPHNPAPRRLLDGNGIASVRFGQRRVAVTTELERLLGPPHETIPGICGFGHTTDWIGLRMNSRDPHLTAQLTLYFKYSRFVGYDYLENRTDPLLRRSFVHARHDPGADARRHRGPCSRTVRKGIRRNERAARDTSLDEAHAAANRKGEHRARADPRRLTGVRPPGPRYGSQHGGVDRRRRRTEHALPLTTPTPLACSHE